MALSGQVGNNIAPFKLPAMTIPISCHLATLTWLYREVRQRAQKATELGQIDVNDVIKAIAEGGSLRETPYRGTLAVSRNSVIVFMCDGQPMHSCTAISTTQIGGYNQSDWFRTPGVGHGYSSHNVTDFRWGRGNHANEVMGNAANPYCRLYTTIEPVAKRAFIENA